MVYWIPRAPVINYYGLADLKNRIYSLIVPEARNLKSRCWQSHGSSRGSREGSFPLPALAPPSIPCTVVAYLQSLPHLASVLCLLVCLVVFFLSLIRTLTIVFRACPNPGWSFLKILILVVSVKVRSPADVPGGHICFWGPQFSPLNRVLKNWVWAS